MTNTDNEKKQDLVRKYLSDQLALESHIYQAVDKQVKETEDEPDVNPTVVQIRDTLEQHVNGLKARLEALGGNPASPVKEAGAAVAGVAAGVIDAIRTNKVSKALRDTYTAISLSNISYVMLSTTALSCGDHQTADLAARNLKDNAQFVMDIGGLIPALVIRDLSDEVKGLDASAAGEARKIYSAAWK